ncbi:MAG: glutamate racemase [Spirochaetia bacterium]|nr:glutamate racemase [Spirochaetia bacterium]
MPNRVNAEKPVGVFDSGLGGLTVLSAIQEKLPNENLIYFGDTARVPYGSKSKETVIKYSLEILDFLLEKKVKMIVAACNTVSAYAIEEMRKKSSVPVIGVIEPCVKTVSQKAPENEKIAVIATKSTIKSGAYEKLLKKVRPDVYLFSKAAPLFVPLVEEGFSEKAVTEEIIKEYLDEISKEKIKHIILGCTHYPLLKKTIKRIYPEFILYDSSIETALFLELKLKENQLQSQNKAAGQIELFVSDVTDSLYDLEKLFFGKTIDRIEKVLLGW